MVAPPFYNYLYRINQATECYINCNYWYWFHSVCCKTEEQPWYCQICFNMLVELLTSAKCFFHAESSRFCCCRSPSLWNYISVYDSPVLPTKKNCSVWITSSPISKVAQFHGLAAVLATLWLPSILIPWQHQNLSRGQHPCLAVLQSSFLGICL